jgi:hypothetical protein
VTNLIILLKLDYYDVTIIDKINCFVKGTSIMAELWFANLNILLKLDYYDSQI